MTENHFRSHFWPFQINTQLLFVLIFFTKWLPTAILDDRKSLLIAFRTFQINTHFFFSQNGCRRPFWMTENHIGWHFSLIFFPQKGCWLPFRMTKNRFGRISHHFGSIRNFYLFFIFFTKCLPAAILDDRKSLSNVFFAILDQYATFFFMNFFFKIAAGSHFVIKNQQKKSDLGHFG